MDCDNDDEEPDQYEIDAYTRETVKEAADQLGEHYNGMSGYAGVKFLGDVLARCCAIAGEDSTAIDDIAEHAKAGLDWAHDE